MLSRTVLVCVLLGLLPGSAEAKKAPATKKKASASQPRKKIFVLHSLANPGRLVKPQLWVVLPRPELPVPSAPVARAAVQASRRLVALRGARQAALAEHARRWQDLLEPRPVAFWTALDRHLGKRVPAYRRAFEASVGRASRQHEQGRVALEARLAPELRRADREEQAAWERVHALLWPRRERLAAEELEALAAATLRHEARAATRLLELHDEQVRDGASSGESSGPVPRASHEATVQVLRRLVERAPAGRRRDSVRLLLGTLLLASDRGDEGTRALLELACERGDTILACTPRQAQSAPPGREDRGPGGILAEAWLRLAREELASSRLPEAEASLQRALALAPARSRLHLPARYLLAWTHFRLDRLASAADGFDQVAAATPAASPLHRAAVDFLAVAVEDEGWDRPLAGALRLEERYRGRLAEPHVREVYRALVALQLDETSFTGACKTLELLQQHWPTHPENPVLQRQEVFARLRERSFEAAMAAAETLRRRYGPGGAWWRASQGRPEVLAAGGRLAEQASLFAVLLRHRMAVGARPTSDEARRQRDADLAAAAAGYRRWREEHRHSPYVLEARLGEAMIRARADRSPTTGEPRTGSKSPAMGDPRVPSAKSPATGEPRAGSKSPATGDPRVPGSRGTLESPLVQWDTLAMRSAPGPSPLQLPSPRFYQDSLEPAFLECAERSGAPRGPAALRLTLEVAPSGRIMRSRPAPLQGGWQPELVSCMQDATRRWCLRPGMSDEESTLTLTLVQP